MDHETTITSTLSILEEAPAYNQWIFEKMRPWLGETILEVGCGTGNLTGWLLSTTTVIASDINEDYLQIVGDKFQGHPNFKDILVWDIRAGEPFWGVPQSAGLNAQSTRRSHEEGGHARPPLQRSPLKTPIDTVVCSNVL